ncbi:MULTISPECIES: PAS domain S-box protein [unclassified Achromobacter]|uniref:PAS domain S-box protein n=1 Tax=unclassified Achromobacter TaxID=2626865 RepID=UPI001303ED51|nr:MULTISPECIES: PAS domain S-box protein [unclassified Achromobacter]
MTPYSWWMRLASLVYVSPACESILGYTPAEMMGRPMLDFLAVEDRARTIKEALLVMSGHPRIGFENRYVHKDGHYVDIMWSARWSEEHRLRIGVARDVSARKQAEAMQRATFAISQAAHDAVDLSALSRGIHDTLASLFPIEAMTLAIHDGESGGWRAIYRYGTNPGVPDLDWVRAQALATQAVMSRQVQWERRRTPPGAPSAGSTIEATPAQPEASIGAIDVIVQGLCDALACSLMLHGTDFRVRVSTGTAIYPDDAASLGELMQLADKRMYLDKSGADRKRA